jgi:hypothetical protein
LSGDHRLEGRKLGRAALTVAVLVLFFIGLTLTALLRLLLTRLTALVLPLLPRLTALLPLSGLTALLTLLFRIVCHDYSS